MVCVGRCTKTVDNFLDSDIIASTKNSTYKKWCFEINIALAAKCVRQKVATVPIMLGAAHVGM
jgi:hypothetical protein